MSYDLLVLVTHDLDDARIRERVESVMETIETTDVDLAVTPDARVAAFFAELMRQYPGHPEATGSDDADLDAIPWSVSPQIDAPDWVYLCVSWSRAEEMREAVTQLAAKHRLAVYDPQSEAIVQHAATSDAPVLLATSERGDTWEDPSEDGLFMMFEDIEDGAGTYLIVESLTDPTGQTYAQTSRNDDGSYVVEYRDGSPERHFATTAPDMRSAHRLITGWAFDLPGWRDGSLWQRLSF